MIIGSLFILFGMLCQFVAKQDIFLTYWRYKLKHLEAEGHKA